MRTTLNIDDHLYREVKRLAATHDRTVTELIEEALRSLLLTADAPNETGTLEFPTFAGGRHPGLRPGVDLRDNAALADIMEDPAGAAS